MKYLVNPRRGARKRKSRKHRTAAQKRATARMIAANKRARAGSESPAREPRRRTVAKRTRRKGGARRSTASRKRSAHQRRHALRRKRVHPLHPGHRVVSYRRNPGGGIVKQMFQQGKDAAYVLVGGAAARTVSNLIPIQMSGYAGVAKDAAVAVGVRMLAAKMLGQDAARFIGAGAMQIPLKSLITTIMPGAAALLGTYDSLGAYMAPQAMGDYLPRSGGFAGQPYGAGMNELGEYIETY